jgi:hypothetical protein
MVSGFRLFIVAKSIIQIFYIATSDIVPQNTDPSELGNQVNGVCSLFVQFTGPGYTISNGPGKSTTDGVLGP